MNKRLRKNFRKKWQMALYRKLLVFKHEIGILPPGVSIANDDRIITLDLGNHSVRYLISCAKQVAKQRGFYTTLHQIVLVNTSTK